MKLATYRDGSRDGQLVVVARDLGQACYASGIASRLQQVLDDWSFLAPQLAELSAELNAGRAPHAFTFEPGRCMAPLPRAFQLVDALACPVQAGQAAGAGAAGGAPWLAQAASDELLGACDDVLAAEELEIDFAAQLAAITGDVRRGSTPQQALAGVRLLMLGNALVLRALAGADGAPPPQARPATAFSPVAVTPDELEGAWQDGRVQLTLQCSVNGRRFGLCEAGPQMRWHFGELLAQLARTRNVRAGSIVGTGALANPDGARGHACIADRRAHERAATGQAATGYLRHGDSVRIEMKARNGQSVFGAIDQDIAPPP